MIADNSANATVRFLISYLSDIVLVIKRESKRPAVIGLLHLGFSTSVQAFLAWTFFSICKRQTVLLVLVYFPRKDLTEVHFAVERDQK